VPSSAGLQPKWAPDRKQLKAVRALRTHKAYRLTSMVAEAGCLAPRPAYAPPATRAAPPAQRTGPGARARPSSARRRRAEAIAIDSRQAGKQGWQGRARPERLPPHCRVPASPDPPSGRARIWPGPGGFQQTGRSGRPHASVGRHARPVSSRAAGAQGSRAPHGRAWEVRAAALALALAQALAQQRVHAERALDQRGRGAAGPRLHSERQRPRLAGRPADADARVGQPVRALDAQRQRQRARARAQLKSEPRARAARVLMRQAIVLDQRARGGALAGRREDPGDTAALVG